MVQSAVAMFTWLVLFTGILEAQSPAKIVFGTNVAGISSETREVPFVDIMKYARPWGTRNIAWVDGGRNPYNSALTDSIAFDEQGYPLKMPAAIAGTDTTQIVFTGWYDLAAFPAGDYTLLWEGDGEIGINGRAEIRSTAPNRMVVGVQPEEEATLEILINRSNPENRVRNIRFLIPGAEATYKTRPFNPRWLEKLELFSVIRFMDWGRTNNWGFENPWDVFPDNGGDSLKTGWEHRAKADYFTFNTPRGVPYEYMVALANQTGKDIWICVPHAASDGYIRQMAEYFKRELHPERTLYVEYSNEVWNWMFAQTQWLYLWGCQARGISWPEGIVPYIQKTFDIFSEVFAPRMNRLVRVAAVQGGWFDVANRVVSNLRPGSYDAVSPTAYFGLSAESDARFDQLAAATTATDLYTEVIATRSSGEMNWLRAIKTGIADVNGVPMLYYEGGQHLTPTPFGEEPSYAQALIDIQRDTLMYNLYTTWFDSLETLVPDGKSTLLMHFSFVSGRSARYGSWGMLETLDQDTARIPAPKFRAIADYIRSHAQSTAISDSKQTLAGPRLHQNHPNPFNPSTQIRFELPAAGNVSLKIFTISGQEIATLLDGRKTAGTHSVPVDASALASGVYLYRLRAGGAVLTRKMVLVK